MPNETKVTREWVKDRIAYHESFSHPKHAKYVAVLRFAIDKNDALKKLRKEYDRLDNNLRHEGRDYLSICWAKSSGRVSALLANAPIEENDHDPTE